MIKFTASMFYGASVGAFLAFAGGLHWGTPEFAEACALGMVAGPFLLVMYHFWRSNAA